MRFGDELILNGTDERVLFLGVIDGEAGTLRVGNPTRGAFLVNDAEVTLVAESRAGCRCH